MLKRIVLYICLIIPHAVNANWLDSLLLMTTQTESWNGNPQQNSLTYSELVPPWNRMWGRDGCLKQFSIPEYPVYLEYCAENPPTNSYFDPKIRVRLQYCNFVCLAFSKDLSWSGECAVWPSPWIFPLIRFCARMANPVDNTTSPPTPEDPGYGTSLNFEGADLADTMIAGTDGLSAPITSPKTCIYWDPWALEFGPAPGLAFIMAFDLFDFNPIKQPFHHTGGLSPFAQTIISLLQAGLNLGDMLANMAGSVGGVITKSHDTGAEVGKILGDVIDFVGKDIVITVLKEFGQLNHVVYESFGCVNIPKGPFPPPYWPTYEPSLPLPTIDAVCPTTMKYETATSTTKTAITAASSANVPCVNSTLNNNAIKNVVRVGYDNIVPVCSNIPATRALQTQCVTISGSTTPSAGATYAASASNGSMISLCEANRATSPCVDTIANSVLSPATTGPAAPIIPAACGVSGLSCGFRPIYGIQLSATSEPTVSRGYDPTLPDCPYIPSSSGQSGTTNPPTCSTNPSTCTSQMSTCQVVIGINSGSFLDLVVMFPTTETTNNNTNTIISSNVTLPLGAMAKSATITPSTITDSSGYAHRFVAAISRSSSSTYYGSGTSNTLLSGGLVASDPTQICVYTNPDPSLVLASNTIQPTGSPVDGMATLVGCVSRATLPTPTLSTCTDTVNNSYTSTSPIACSTTHFDPTVSVALKVVTNGRTYSTQGILATKALANSSNDITTLNLAGNNYTTFATDNSYITRPFPGINSNTGTISPWPSFSGNTGTSIGIANYVANGATFTATPFATPPSQQGQSLFGTYCHGAFPNAAPGYCASLTPNAFFPNATVPVYIVNQNPTGSSYLDANNGIVPTGAQYISGLEYQTGAYVVGGTQLCLSMPATDSCTPSNPTNCVLARLTNTAYMDCGYFNTNVTHNANYPGISLCNGNAIPTCAGVSGNTPIATNVANVTDPNNNHLVAIYQCGTTNATYCYTYNSTSITALCTPSTAPADRLWPLAAGGSQHSDPLYPYEYYNPSTQVTVPSLNQLVNQSCINYLSDITSQVNPAQRPYITTTACTSIAGCTPVESFVDTSTPQTISVYNCSGINCYTFTPTQSSTSNSTSCQINSSIAIRELVGTTISGTTLDCPTFINNLVSPGYGNIPTCSTQQMNATGLIETLTSTHTSGTPTIVDIYEYMTTVSNNNNPAVLASTTVNYCYNPRSTSPSPCALDITNTTRTRPSSFTCSTYASLLSQSYVGIADCSTPPVLCPTSNSITNCSTTQPICSPQAIATDGSTTLTINSCSYTVSFSNAGSQDSVSSSQNYTCYTAPGNSSNSQPNNSSPNSQPVSVQYTQNPVWSASNNQCNSVPSSVVTLTPRNISGVGTNVYSTHLDYALSNILAGNTVQPTMTFNFNITNPSGIQRVVLVPDAIHGSPNLFYFGNVVVNGAVFPLSFTNTVQLNLDGNNNVYTSQPFAIPSTTNNAAIFNIPSSALVDGTNTISIQLSTPEAPTMTYDPSYPSCAYINYNNAGYNESCCFNLSAGAIYFVAGTVDPFLSNAPISTPTASGSCNINSTATVLLPSSDAATPPADLAANSSTAPTPLPSMSIPQNLVNALNPPSTTPTTVSSTSYNPATNGIRNKTPSELGLCVTIPAPASCSAVTSASSETGYATWTAAAPGTASVGTCQTGASPMSNAALSRYCYMNTSGTPPYSAAFEALGTTLGCGPGTIQYTQNPVWSASNNQCNSTPSSVVTLTPRNISGIGTNVYSTHLDYALSNILTGNTVRPTMTFNFNITNPGMIQRVVLVPDAIHRAPNIAYFGNAVVNGMIFSLSSTQNAQLNLDGNNNVYTSQPFTIPSTTNNAAILNIPGSALVAGSNTISLQLSAPEVPAITYNPSYPSCASIDYNNTGYTTSCCFNLSSGAVYFVTGTVDPFLDSIPLNHGSPDWEISFTYPASSQWTPTSTTATPTYYASDFVNSSMTVGNLLIRGVNGTGSKRSAFVPGPALPTNVPGSSTLTAYLNITDITKIAKVAYIDTNCPWDAFGLCYNNTTSPSLNTKTPIVFNTVNSSYPATGHYQLGYEFYGTFNLTVNGSQTLNPSPNSFFGWWSDDNNGGYDGWLIYDGSNSMLHNGLNTIQIHTSTTSFTNRNYPNALGFWYIELKP